MSKTSKRQQQDGLPLAPVRAGSATALDPQAEARENAMNVMENQGLPQRPKSFLWFYVTIAGSMLLRVSLLDFESGDYTVYLSNWYDFFLEHGQWHGLGLRQPDAIYHPLYLYLISLSTLLPLPKLHAIKLFSLVGDYVAAWYVWRLSKRYSPQGWAAWAAMTAFLFLPTVVMNGALWGQCDVLYTAGFLASLFYLVERRPVTALVAFGFSCAFKPQAIFWCPLLAGLFVAGRLPWKWIWVPATVYIGCALPALLAGKPVMDALWRWGSDFRSDLTAGAPNWYQWVFEQQPEVFWWPGIVLTLVATAFFVLCVEHTAASGSSGGRWLLSLAFLSVLFPPFLLPGMHDRYFFPADVLSVLYAVFVPGGYRPAILVQSASAFAYLPFLFLHEPVPRPLLALVMTAALGLVVVDFAKMLFRQAEAGQKEKGTA
jgi:Gpi18-like mannosyltransferase